MQGNDRGGVPAGADEPVNDTFESWVLRQLSERYWELFTAEVDAWWGLGDPKFCGLSPVFAARLAVKPECTPQAFLSNPSIDSKVSGVEETPEAAWDPFWAPHPVSSCGNPTSTANLPVHPQYTQEGLLPMPSINRKVFITNGLVLRAERPLRVERAVAHMREAKPQGEDERYRWYKIEVGNKANTAEVYLYDEIGYWGVSAADFVADLNEVAKDAKAITVRINSPGGDVFDGIAIGNALRNHKASVTVQIDGLAASAASFIAAMAGDEVVMGAYSQMMIHDASGLAMGNAGDMREMADLLDRISDNIAQVYADKAGGSRSFWRDRMRDETWYDGPEAVAAGLADSSLAPEDDEEEPTGARNAWDLSGFSYPGRQSAPAPKNLADAPEEQREPEPPLAIPKIDPEWFRATMQRLTAPKGAPDPDIVKAAIDLAANNAPAPEPEKNSTKTEERSDGPAMVIDPTDFYNAIRKALV